MSAKYIRRFQWDDPRSGMSVDLPIGCERFLAPEIFFNPDLLSGFNLVSPSTSSATGGGTASSGNSNSNKPLPVLLDSVIQACPIDCRRALYGNIVLSGGSTMFAGLRERLESECRLIVSKRLAYTTDVRSQIVSSIGKCYQG